MNLQEFEPLTRVLSIVPNKLHRAFYTLDVTWTCIDVTKEYIAIGSNVGFVYLIERSNEKLHKLICKGKDVIVTVMKLCQNVDNMVGVGTSTGQVIIFQLPSILPGRNKQLKMYDVSNLHHSKIKDLVWSQNGQKLYSGDSDGAVYCTEFQYSTEFEANSKSYFVLKEPNEIVQLDYSVPLLLVSTRWRTLVYNVTDKKSCQIGQKERKSLGEFGAVFQPGTVSYQQEDIVLFASRPRHRIWKALSNGNVKATYLFKELLTKSAEGITLLQDTINLYDVVAHKLEDLQFGPLCMYQDKYLVTYNESALFILDPAHGDLLGYHTNIGPILDVAVCNDEIFLLRNGAGRRLIRVAQTPSDVSEINVVDIKGFHPNMESLNVGNMLDAFKEVGEKIQGAVEVLPLKKSSDPVPPWGYVADKNHTPASAMTPLDNLSAKKLETCTSDVRLGQSHLKDGIQTNGVETEIEKECEAENRVEDLAVHYPDILPLNAGNMINEDKDEMSVFPVSNLSMPKDVEKVNRWNSVMAASNDFSTDIVFHSQKTKKKGKKKVKHKIKEQPPSVNSDHVSSNANGETSNYNETSDTSYISVCSLSCTNSVETTTLFKEENEPISSEQDIEKKRLELESKLTTFPSVDLQHCDTRLLSKSIEREENIIQKSDHVKDLHVENDNEISVNGTDETCYVRNKKSEYSVITSGILNVSTDNTNRTLQIDNCVSHEQEDYALNKAENFGIQDYRPSCMPSQPDFCTYSACNNSNASPLLSGEEDKQLESKKEPTNILNHAHEQIEGDSFNLSTNVNRDAAAEVSPTQSVENHNYVDPNEDIYSVYASKNSISSTLSSSQELFVKGSKEFFNAKKTENDQSIEDMISKESNEIEQETTESEENDSEVVLGQCERPKGFVDSWTEFLVNGNVQCISVSTRHVWIVDKSDKVYWSHLAGPGIRWHKIDCSAQRISVSPNGGIVWRIFNGKLYAGTKITTRAPAGLKWVDFVQKDVVSISVDDHVGWYVKSNGEVIMHKKLSRDRPCFKSIKVPCDDEVIEITCRKNVVWAITADLFIIVRNGVKDDVEEGSSWSVLNKGHIMMVSHCDIGEDNTGWVIDLMGRVWFTTDVTPLSPCGSGRWMQVALAEYLMQDSTAFDTLKHLASNPTNLLKMRKQEDKGGLISARCNGTWVCPGYRNTIHICRGSMLGHKWERFNLPGIVNSLMKWVNISVTGINSNEGLIWAQQPSGDLFCFNPYTTRHNSSLKVFEVKSPEMGSGQPFICICALSDVVWTLMPSGKIYARTGIRKVCPHGLNWVQLNLQQLGKVKIIWLTASTVNLWALDNKGQIYFRIGIEPSSKQLLNPAWVPIDGTPHMLGAKFNKVFAGSLDWMVWATDNYGNIYARKGISDSLPIGTHWVIIKGPKCETLCLGNKLVYAVNKKSEILQREGIERNNPCGDHWIKIPGSILNLSVTSNELLWGINKDHKLCRRFTHFLQRKAVLEDLQTSVKEDIDGWEVI